MTWAEAGVPALRARPAFRTPLWLAETGRDGRLSTRAPAKVNLTLHVLGRRPDGYHELESLVAFAGAADRLVLEPGERLSIVVEGPTAGAAGPPERNLVIRVVEALRARRTGLKTGAFHLTKRLPAAAGIGGGSSDAAAALRLIARLNGLSIDDPDIVASARATGADIPVCLTPTARVMRGAGEDVGPALDLSRLFAVLVNPGVAVPTADVFRALRLAPGDTYRPPASDVQARPRHLAEDVGASIADLAVARNDLEPPALTLAPAIGIALDRLRASPGCRLARMSGSGATVFGLYGDCHAAAHAAGWLKRAEPAWWVKATILR